ncbi:MAG TPA: hypothetical protein VGI22_16480 [Xanthobacteraceae bacterium]
MTFVGVQQRRHDGFVQIGDRALEDILGLGADIADFLEKNFREDRRAGFRGRGARDVSAPYRTVQLTLNVLGPGRNGADLGGARSSSRSMPLNLMVIESRHSTANNCRPGLEKPRNAAENVG